MPQTRWQCLNSSSTGQFSAAANASYPGKLPALLSAFLDGQDIDEPFELWS
jgi:hypothetical protein